MLAEPRRFPVDEDAAGLRLDLFLAACIPGASRSQVQALIEDGSVRIDDREATRASKRLQAGSTVALMALLDGAKDEVEQRPEPAPDIPLEIIYRDDDLLVIDKESGRVVHPAIGHDADTLVNALAARDPAIIDAFDGSYRSGVVHRLDRETSGLIVMARHPEAATRLKEQFAARTVEKRYLALVVGVPSPTEGRIEAPIARDPRRRQRMAVVAGGKAAATKYRVLTANAERALVEAAPETGRTHQIRVHLKAIGHPVLGDRVYGRGSARIDRVALHAAEIEFAHPRSGERLSFRAPPPSDFLDAITASALHYQVEGT